MELSNISALVKPGEWAMIAFAVFLLTVANKQTNNPLLPNPTVAEADEDITNHRNLANGEGLTNSEDGLVVSTDADTSELLTAPAGDTPLLAVNAAPATDTVVDLVTQTEPTETDGI